MKHIAILDFGSQYTHLIARTVREMEVLAKIYPHDMEAAELQEAQGVIISGGPQFVNDDGAIKIDPKIFELGVPILGLCYGHQLIAHMLGGEVRPGDTREYGRAELKVLSTGKVFEGISGQTQVWMSHGDTVTKLPEGFEKIGETPDCPITAMANEKRKIYGFQFHPEVMHTHEGAKMLENFVLGVCRAEKNWKVEDLVGDLSEKIRKQVGNKKVFILCSGGVDSNVAFALLTKALGKEKVLGLYIDTGFMRKNESEEIMENFKKVGFDNIKKVEAGDTFFARLIEVYEPEEKRKIIGQTFLDVKDKIAKELGLNDDEWLLGQGTIYPDTIESGATKNADRIKTHHNRVDAIQELIEKGLVVEPLVDFYKDEVRTIGRMLRLPEELIERHPFPGPGLAIRCLCENKAKDAESLKETEEKLKEFYILNFPDLKFSLLPIRSVGVQGDNRTYAHPVAVWNNDSWTKLSEISSRATNSVKGVNRALLLLNPEEKNKFSLLKGDVYLTRERINLLQEIDEIVNKNIKAAGKYNDIWQFPVVMVPVTDGSECESIVLRPINSRDAMTLDFYQMDKNLLEKITDEILSTGKISYVFYDITNKPPGTVEWE